MLSLGLAVSLQIVTFALLEPAAPQAGRSGANAEEALYAYTAVNPYGANTFLSREVEDWKREKTVQMMAEGGLGWIKQQFLWSEIEPKRGHYWDDKYNQNSWGKYDRIVDLAEQHGLRVIARLDHTPEWARGPQTNPQTPPSNPEDYANFVAQFVEHYRGRVQFLQIWNEPNLKGEWGGKLDAAGYVDLLRRAHARAKATDPRVVILSAPLAQTLEGGDRGLDELLYLQQLYDAGLRGSYDILLANGYGFDQPPDAQPGRQTLNLRRVELVREVMVRNGDAAKPVWLNEYGWNAAPESFPPDKLIWSRVTEEQQALWTFEGIRYARQHWPWLGVVNIWYFRQVGDIPLDLAEYYFRMVDPEFTPRPLYRALGGATAGQRLATPGRYGPLSPALLTGGRWSTILDERSGRLALQSERPYDQITIHFRGNGLTIEGESGPRGGRLGIEIDGSTEAVGRLPRDERGRRFLDFTAGAQGPTLFPVVSGLDPLRPTREHVAVLTVLPAADGQGAGQVTLSGIEVAAARSLLPGAALATALATLGLGVATLALRAIDRLRRGQGRTDA